MELPKYLLTLLLLIVIGFFIGTVVFKCLTLNKIFSQNNLVHTSDNQLTTITDESLHEETNTLTKITLETPTKSIPEHIKAVYLTGWTTGSKTKRQKIIEDLTKYGFNAVVIDIKDEAGKVTYNSNIQTAIDISASTKMISNLSEVISDFHAANIYVIGRIVTFKDPIYAKNFPEHAYKTQDGSLWEDYSGNNWPNPYNTASWDYPILLAKEAAELRLRWNSIWLYTFSIFRG